MLHEKQKKVLVCAEMITLAVAPSVGVSLHCASLSGGGSLGRVVIFSEISSVLDLGAPLSSTAKKGEKIRE